MAYFSVSFKTRHLYQSIESELSQSVKNRNEDWYKHLVTFGRVGVGKSVIPRKFPLKAVRKNTQGGLHHISNIIPGVSHMLSSSLHQEKIHLLKNGLKALKMAFECSKSS
jgi:hypothetical protein